LDSTAKLEVEALAVRRGPLRVVDGVSFEVPVGQVVGIVGLNGAGKSSLLACLGGELPVDAGRLMFRGEDLTRAPSWERCRRGIALIPERRRLFGALSVLDNLLLGGHLRTKASAGPAWTACLRSSRCCGTSSTRKPGNSPAVSSRCLPSAEA